MTNVEFMDLWSIWHIIFGSIIAFISWKVIQSESNKLLKVIVLSYVLFVVWEIVEELVLARYVSQAIFGESIVNKVGDIVFDTIGFLCVFTYLRMKSLGEME